MDDKKVCIICLRDIDNEESSVLAAKGAETINHYSRARSLSVFATVGSNVHISCRKKFTDIRGINKSAGTSSGSTSLPQRRTRTSQQSYDVKNDCLFCGTYVDWSRKHSRWIEPVKVRTIEFADSVKSNCKKT